MSLNVRKNGNDIESFLLYKDIFLNIFEKDIKRVYLYKKTERLAKAVSLMIPSFAPSPEIADRADRLSLALVDAAILPPRLAREALARELLALSSVMAIARVRGLISVINADLIIHEARMLLDEVAGYEEPRVSIPESPTLPSLARKATSAAPTRTNRAIPHGEAKAPRNSQGHMKDKEKRNGRSGAILSVLKEKGASDIRAISSLIRDVSEKTIQRELTALVAEGSVLRTGTRRWTLYSLPQ